MRNDPPNRPGEYTFHCAGCGKITTAFLLPQDIEDGCRDGTLHCVECLNGLVNIQFGSDLKGELTDSEIEETLRLIDAECVSKNEPILSCFVTKDDGQPSPVFFESVEKYNLRKPGESDQEVRDRIQNESHEFYKN